MCNWLRQEKRILQSSECQNSPEGFVLGPFGLLLLNSVASGIVEGQIIPEMQQKVVEIKNLYENLKKQILTSRLRRVSSMRT